MNNLAAEISRLIHNTCKDVPHDIGLQVMELVKGEEIPFNPELIPGIKDIRQNTFELKNAWELSRKDGLVNILRFNSETNNVSVYCYRENNSTELFPLLWLANIPNHNFGLALLRNLGVIE